MATFAIASDHSGYKLKQELITYFEERGYQVEDMGCHGSDYVDYPDYAQKVAEAVVADQDVLGVLICGTGIGMSMAANKLSGVRAALCHSEYEAQMSRTQFNANVLCLGGRMVTRDESIRIVARFLRAEYAGRRHEKRLQKMEKLAG